MPCFVQTYNSCISSNTSNSLCKELRIVHNFILVREINKLGLALITLNTVQLHFGSTNFTTAKIIKTCKNTEVILCQTK